MEHRDGFAVRAGRTVVSARRPWWQFSLRRLLMLPVVCALVAGWYFNRYRIQERAEEKLREAGAELYYGSQFPDGIDKRPINEPPSGWPRWTQKPFSSDYHAVYVSLRGEGCDADLENIGRLPYLRVLVLTRSDISDDGLANLSSLTTLEVLDLRGTQITGRGMQYLRGNRALRDLKLACSTAGDAALNNMECFPDLVNLHLWETEVTDSGLAHLRGLRSLRFLSLDKTKITDAGLAHLEGLKSLQILWLDETDISDAGLEHLASLRNLEYLCVCDAKRVTCSGLTKLEGLTKLRRIEFTCPLPESYANRLRKSSPRLEFNGPIIDDSARCNHLDDDRGQPMGSAVHH